MPAICIRWNRNTLLSVANGLFILAAAPLAFAQSSSVVISQIYGGGGAATPVPFRCDFIELFNRGAVAVDLTTWSVQYASANGNSWSTAQTNLTAAGMLAPGQYLLIQQSCGAVGSPLPIPPDVTGSIALSATAGKVALVNHQTGLPALNSFAQGQNGVVDIVSYGASNPTEGAATIAPTNMQAVARLENGCRDTNDNNPDFAILAPPVPRNKQSTFNPCMPNGACCISGTCSQLTASACASGQGTYLGDGSVCGEAAYSVTVGSNALEDISTTGVAGAAQGDNTMSAALNLPFVFPYVHANRTQYRYSTNGWFCFDTAQSDSNPVNAATLPQTSTPNAALMPFWDDLASDTSGANRIFTQTLGTAPNRRFIIQYNNVRKVSNNARYTFQAVLFELSGCIEYRYAAYAVPDAGDAAIGWENNQGVNGGNVDPLTLAAGMSITLCPGTRCALGACCRQTDCSLVNAATCSDVLAGMYQGDGVACDPNPCVIGACCLGPAECVSVSPAQCAASGGDYRGDGSECGNLDPPCAATGACCVGGNCQTLSAATCQAMSGVYIGDNQLCESNTCFGACCLIDGECLVMQSDACLAQQGLFRGATTICMNLEPPCAAAGACCTGETCELRTSDYCDGIGGVFGGEGTTCTPNPCAGACCLRDGSCTQATEADCLALSGEFRGTGTDCDNLAMPCAAGGACCGANGSGECTVLTEAACLVDAGTWRGANTTCTPSNPCQGACCLIDGSCVRIGGAACAAQGGLYQGDNAECGAPSHPCPAAGACCTLEGPCVRRTEAACMAAGGAYRGDQVSCERDYQAATFNPDFVDISGFGTPLGIADPDDGSVVVTLPFSLRFYGVEHATARVSVNGFITFGPPGSYFNNVPIPDAGDPNDTIYPLWDDLHLRTTGRVFVATLGIAPAQVYIVQWHMVDQFSPSNLNNLMTFQAKLHESDGCIEFHYQTVVAETPAGDYTIGVEDPTGTLATSVGGATIGTGSSMRRFCPDVPRCAGACCLSDGTCAEISEPECSTRLGVYQGEAVHCAMVNCPVVCLCRGDMTGDGSRDGDDIGEFVRCIIEGGGSSCVCADVNADMQLNGDDVAMLANQLVQGQGCQ